MTAAGNDARTGVEALVLTTVRISTRLQGQTLTNASGFFFERDGRLFLVTSRHVLLDPAGNHRPDEIRFAVHSGGANLAQVGIVTCPLYAGGAALWREGRDSAGEVDVATLELDRGVLPDGAVFHAFGPANLLAALAEVEIGAPLLLLGFPLGFQDTLHYLPVARHAIVASSFGVRFQGLGQFLTDGRAHRGSSGGPVVMRCRSGAGLSSWKLLGVHSSRFDIGSRDAVLDEALGLNCAWYADILMTLTQPPAGG